ncbi:NUDIX domain-containing protein [Paenibacillus sp. P26]|nr:NUDIX domain-containing protein [Paenibacillus sp. P26]
MRPFQRKGCLLFAGGKREPGETDTGTLLREIEEELSVRIQPDTVSYFATFEAQAHGKSEGVSVRMTCYTAEYEGEPRPASEIAELAWLTYADRERVSPVVQLIFDQLQQQRLLG